MAFRNVSINIDSNKAIFYCLLSICVVFAKIVALIWESLTQFLKLDTNKSYSKQNHNTITNAYTSKP